MCRKFILWSRAKLLSLTLLGLGTYLVADESKLRLPAPQPDSIRIATFNVSLHRKALGELSSDLERGDKQLERLARIIGLVQPDILLANEVDYDGGKSARLLLEKCFSKSASSDRALKYFFTSESNTGLPSGLDLDHDGKVGGPNDAYGFGVYPGQYALAVFSRFPIDESSVRTFQKFLWSQMPGALRPIKGDGVPYWSDEIWPKLRLSSKTHMDVPINVDGKVLHVLASHPTPPVFDKEEDRNGCRNHDEIRLIMDYANGGLGTEYLISDQGTKGPLDAKSNFVILGDLNADPKDGGGKRAAIEALLNSPRVEAVRPAPRSQGAVEASTKQGKINLRQSGDPAEDTSDFNDQNSGNLRCDFVLPSNNCEVVASGVFWPTEDELKDIDPQLLSASDHRLVWVDMKLP
jgi:Endonuclease/Exonuclease/phosphatase family